MNAKRRLRLFALCGALAFAAGATAADDLGEHLRACAACHGEHGEGLRGAEYFPHLAGKPAGYLFEQLQGFRDGRRANRQMTWFVEYANDAWLRAMAEHYSQLPPRTRAADASPPQQDAAQRALAEKLVREGDAARKLPACDACHGANLAGLDPGVPALVALPADYVAAQLGAWRAGTRESKAPDCMHNVARALRPEEIQALGVWLARQSNADGVRPAPAGSFELPRSCGAIAATETAP